MISDQLSDSAKRQWNAMHQVVSLIVTGSYQSVVCYVIVNIFVIMSCQLIRYDCLLTLIPCLLVDGSGYQHDSFIFLAVGGTDYHVTGDWFWFKAFGAEPARQAGGHNRANDSGFPSK